MSFRFKLLIALLSLFALASNSALACGKGSTEKSVLGAVEKSCCSKKDPENRVSCCKKQKDIAAKTQLHKCPQDGECGACHCPCGTVISAHSINLIAELPPELLRLSALDRATLQQAFYFNQHMPEAVYLPIWQPPKLRA